MRALFVARRVMGLAVFICPMALASVVACSSDDDSSGADSGASNPCSTSATYFECTACCGLLPTYFDLLQTAGDDCVCDVACKTECESACALPNPTAPTAACDTCRNAQATGATCTPRVQAACEAEPECAKAQACSRAAACGDKPDVVDAG